MNKSEYLKKLNNAFKDFKFFPSDHHYEFKGKKIGVSVTTYYTEYENEFNQQQMAELSAIKQNKTVPEILNEWNYKNQFACFKGSNGHNYVQSLWSGESINLICFDESNAFKLANKAIFEQ